MMLRIAVFLLGFGVGVAACAHYPHSIDDLGGCSVDHAIKGLCR
ncbi:MAG TPA: hypothetical protein VK602_00730 [Phyllobacterium sp.]|nr:hypothetical protein [Phyllobacterium sp.]